MKICHVITRLIVGGAQENTLLTCEGLIERGHDVTLLAGPETGPEGSLWDWAQSCCDRVIRLACLRRNVNPVTDLRGLRELRRALGMLGCDVVHTHSSKAGILGRRAARRAGVPLVVHTIHGMSFNRTQPRPVYRLYRGLERWAARSTDVFVSVADAMTEQAVAAGLAPRDRFTTIYSGMRTQQFAANPQTRRHVRDRWGVEDDVVVVGSVARLFDNKGYEELLAALPEVVRAVPNVHFVWVGDGPNRAEYERRLEALGLRDRVHLVGLVRPEIIPQLLTGFDVVVHLSRWEGLPRVAAQALLSEVPVVCSDVDGAPEVVIPRETGELVALDDAAALVRCLAELARSPDLRRTLGRRGRERCLEQFDHRRMVDRLEELYTRLLAERG